MACSCSGCSGCGGGCSRTCQASCSSCDSCGSGCANSCSGCKGSCQGTCLITCSGCSGCGGCGGCANRCDSCTGCDSGCQGCNGTCTANCANDCSGGCSGCNGCGGACSTSCTACTGSCTGACDNGCTSTASEAAYTTLGATIVTNALIKATDVTQVESFVINELQRRNLTIVDLAPNVAEGKPAYCQALQNVLANCKTAGYTGTETEGAGTTISAARVQKYITYAKSLYSKILKA